MADFIFKANIANYKEQLASETDARNPPQVAGRGGS
jgi:hypothetical protein